MDSIREKAIHIMSMAFIIVFCVGIGALMIFVEMPVEAASLPSTTSTIAVTAGVNLIEAIIA